MQPDFWIDFVIPVLAIVTLFSGLSVVADLVSRINWNYVADRRRLYVGEQLKKQYSPRQLEEMKVLARHMASVNEENW